MKLKKTNLNLFVIIIIVSIVTGIYRDGFASLFPFLMEDLDLNRTQLGFHSTFLFVISATVAVFSGRMVDFIGAKKCMIIATTIMGIFISLHYFIFNYTSILILASLTGIGMSMVVPATNKSIYDLFSKKNISTLVGINFSGFAVGGLISASILPIVGIFFGWRIAILLLGLVFLLTGFIIYNYFNPKFEEGSVLKKRYYLDEKQIETKSYKELFLDSRLLLLCFLGLILGFITSAIASHSTLFFHLDLNLNKVNAGFAYGVIHLGSILGRPGWGLFSDRFLKSNKIIAFIALGLLFSATALIMVFFLEKLKNSFIIICVFAFLIGFSGRGWHGLYFSAIAETRRSGNIGTSIGFSMFFVRLGLMVGPPVIGYIADIRGSYDYSWLILSIIMFLLVSILSIIEKKRSIKKN